MEQQDWAYHELLESLEPDEEIEYVTFSHPYGINPKGPNGEDFLSLSLIGKKLSFDKAKKYFYGWNIAGGYGGEEVIPFFAWTNKRVLFIGCYDGSTWLDSVPRNPCDADPYTVGGG